MTATVITSESKLATRLASAVYNAQQITDQTSTTLPKMVDSPSSAALPENTISTPAIDIAIPSQRSPEARSRSHSTATSAVIAGMDACTSAPCDAETYTIPRLNVR